jgi:hypothetical protein
MQNTQSYEQQSALLHEIITNTVQPNNHELLRHLGQVLGIKADNQVLLVTSSETDEMRQALAEEFGCEVQVFQGDLRHLPYTAGEFHSAIVAVPIVKDLHVVARELSRVLKPAGSLGMVIFSVYRDQMPEDRASAAAAGYGSAGGGVSSGAGGVWLYRFCHQGSPSGIAALGDQ